MLLHFLAFLMLGVLLLAKKQSFVISRKELLWCIIGGMMMAASSLTLFFSYVYMDAGLASTVLFIYPVFVALTMCLVFGEKTTWQIIGSIVLALGGLALISLGGGAESHITWTGIILALISAFFYGAYIVAVRQSPLKNLNSDKLTFYVLMAGIPVFLIRLHGGLDIVLPDSVIGWSCAFGAAFIPTIIAFVFMAIAIAKVGATPTAVLGVLEPATALLVGVTVFGESLTWRSVAGILLIVISVLLVIWSERK